MKFRTGLIVGLAVGYYYGSKAGRERYEQIDDALERVRHSGPYRRLRATADDLIDGGRDRALGLIDGMVDHPEAATRSGPASPTTAAFDAYVDPTLN
jgi:hypothetical protein